MRENIILKFNIEECSERAEKLFLAQSGIGGEGEKFERMREDAFCVWEEIENRVDIKATYSFFDSFGLDGRLLSVKGDREKTKFTCPAFEQINPDSVEGVYFYALTVGDFHMGNRSIMEQLYADIWGTAFTDSAREKLMEEFRKDGEISDSFGPGFYGMETSEMLKMPSCIDFALVGLEVKDSGVILPLKSCAGMVFRVNETYRTMGNACRDCLGNVRTCSLCSMGK